MHTSSLFLALTLGAYAVGVALQRWGGRHPLLNPTLLAIAIVSCVVLLLHIDYNRYFQASQPIHVLLGPAVVALAVPLYRHFSLIRQRAAWLLLALLAGSVSAITSSVIIGRHLGVSEPNLLSLAPKSATAAVSMGIAAKIGGIPAVTAVLTILTGISGAIIAGYVLDALRIRDPAARGFSMGLTSHGIATARAFQEGETAGTFSGLAMGLNAITTAILTPLVIRLLMH
jgi:predicted murein hydrolase (TIGR00659 family)